MKRLTALLSIVILITMFSCEQSGTFTGSQPSDTTNLLKFPKQVQGRYISLSDSAILKINDNVITKTYDNLLSKIHLNEFADSVIVVGDSIIDKETNERFYVGHGGDSLIVHSQWMDTLFQISNENVLKKSGENYFLDILHNKSWDVWKLNLSDKRLKITNIKKIGSATCRKKVKSYRVSEALKERDGEVFVNQ